MELLVPALQGAHSTIGRSTNRGMDKMRDVVHELVKEDEAKKAAKRGSVAKTPGGAEKTGSGDTHQEEDEMPPALTLALRPRRSTGIPGAKNGAKMSNKASPMAQNIRGGLGLGSSPKSQSGEGVESPQASNTYEDGMEDVVGDGSPTAKEVKASPAFTAQGTDKAVFDETSRVNLKRFFYKGKRAGEPTPELGHYRVQENLVMKRVPLAMDFSERKKHESRKSPQILNDAHELGPEDLTKLDFRFASSGSMKPSPSMMSTVAPSPSTSDKSVTSTSWFEGHFSMARSLSLMSTSDKRYDLDKIPGARISLPYHRFLNEISEPNHPEEQDLKTTAFQRIPDCDFDHFRGRKGESGKEFPFFEAGKYDVRYDVVQSKAKVSNAFNKQLARAKTNGYQKPKGMLDEKGTACIQDRSLYRNSPACRPRVTHVRDMSKDLNRPPLMKAAPILHDESDPDVVAAIHDYEMTSDSSTFDRAVIHRHDFAPTMSTSIPRDKAGAGARIAQDDICIRTLHGGISVETQGQLGKTVEELKDSISRRPDLGVMAFEQSKARVPTRLACAYSSLHRPRSHAAPDFSRSAPTIGFKTCTPVKVLQRSRQHDAMPGWTAEAIDNLMSS